MNEISHYKLIYLDTNAVSDVCKADGLMQNFMSMFPPDEDYLLCFSTYTLFEIQKNDIIYSQFKRIYSIFPCAVVMSYFPLGLKEIDFISGEIEFVTPLMFSPVGVVIDGKKLNPNSLDVLLSLPEVIEGFSEVESYTAKYFNSIKKLLQEKEFRKVKYGVGNKKKLFIKLFMRYELTHRFLIPNSTDVDELKLKKMKSLEMLAYCVFFKFFFDDNRNISINDIIDVLIMSTTPYVHTFISEKNSIYILQKIKIQTNLINRIHLLKISQLRSKAIL